MSVRVVLVGAGFFAGFHAEAWHRSAQAELVGVCDLDETAANKLAGSARVFTDARAAIEQLKPDLIDIATPPTTHKAMVELAIEAGIPAICQKPVAPTFAEAQAIEQQVRAASHTVIIHENFRFQPWYREARRLLDAGILGQPYGVSFRLRPGDGQGEQAYLARQPYFQQMERFLIHETAIHFVDTFRFLLGEVTAVSAQSKRLNPVIAGEDAAIVQFDFADGASGLFDGNRLARHSAKNPRLTMGEMWLEGEAATLRLDGNGVLWLQHHGEDEQPHDYDWRDRGFGGDCVYALQAHVCDYLSHGKALENRLSDYIRNLQIEEAIYESAAAKRQIKLEPCH